MFKKRERFERTDVIQPGARTNLIAIVVLAVVAVAMVVLLGVLWSKAKSVSRIGDADLAAALQAQPEPWAVDGHAAVQDNFTNVLVLNVDNVKAAQPTLTGIQIMVLDATDSAGAIATLPADIAVKVGEGDAAQATTASALFESQGAAACVAPVSSATNVKFAHVVVAGGQVWDELGTFKGAGLDSLIGKSGKLLENIATDMGASKLTDVARLAQAIGMDSLTRFDAPVSAEDDGNGGTANKVGWQELDVQLGLYAPVQ